MAIIAQSQGAQPTSCPNSNGPIRHNSPANSTTLPLMSSFVSARRDVDGMMRQAAAAMTRPHGTLMKNTERQPVPARSTVSRRLPSRKPAAPASPSTMP